MNRNIVSGFLLLAIALATVGAAVSGGSKQPADEVLVSTMESELADVGLASEATVQVPVRSGLLSDQPSAPAAVEVAQPVKLRIGDINVEAPVLSVGVDEENRLAVPAADTVGWYKYSSLPGTDGASVLAAHVDYGGRRGAFFDLSDLRSGDRFEVEMSDGSMLTYQVTGNTEYDKSSLPAEDLFRKGGEQVLHLITCGGTFNPDRRSYEANVVISALPVSA